MSNQAPLRIIDLPPANALDGSEWYEASQGGLSVRVQGTALFAQGKSAYEVAKAQGFQGTVVTWLASLVGPKGDQGIQGLQGIQGIAGIQGIQGLQGLSAYQLAVQQQGFAGNLSAWLLSLVGPKGDKGDSGDQGIQGIPGIQGLQGFKGDKGDQGIQGIQGNQGIQGIQGVPGLTAYQVAVSQGYGADMASWLVSLKGAKGDQGIQGVQGIQGNPGLPGIDGKSLRWGNGVPSDAAGVDGEFYINTVAWNLYGPKAGGVWGAFTSLIGPQGQQGVQGIQGIQGIQGVAGNTVLNGAGVPANATGANGDFYFDNTAKAIYGPKAAGVWPAGVSLVGPQGSAGSLWYTGSGAPATGLGVLNDMYMDTATGDYYKKTAAAVWTKQGTLTATAAAVKQAIQLAVSDESTALTAGTGKVSFRAPYDFSLSGIRASLVTAQTSGVTFTVDVKVNGVSILSTKLTLDNGQKSSQTAATAAVLNTQSIYSDDEVTVDITQVGDGTAKGLKVSLIGTLATFANPAWDPAKTVNGSSGPAALSLLNRQIDGDGGSKTVNAKIAGKWYFEAKLTKKTANSSGAHLGFGNAATNAFAVANSSQYGGAYVVYRDDGIVVNTGGPTLTANSATAMAQGDVIGVALDMTGLTWKLYKNGALMAYGTMAADTYYGICTIFSSVYTWLIPTTPQYLPAGYRWWGE